MSYRKRIIYLFLLDSLIVLTSIYFSYYLLLPSGRVITYPLILSSITLLVGHHLFAYIYKLYKRAWEYASVGELLAIFKAISFSIILAAFVQQAALGEMYTRTLVITWMMHILLIGGSRFSWRIVRDQYLKRSMKKKKRTLIIGAGAAGTMVARQLQQNQEVELVPVGFIDDDPAKQNLEILGLPVLGGVKSIKSIALEQNISNIVIAIPSLDRQGINRIFSQCTRTKAKTKILPLIEDLMLGKVAVNEIRDVQVEDLLGREPVELDIHNIKSYTMDQTVLVTGAGGSIGSEICRQVSGFAPSKLVLLGHGENSIYSIEMELRRTYPDLSIETEIADIQDRTKMFSIMKKHKPYVVFHAAAHKHVPLMERNPEEAVKNNILGTRNVAEAASISRVNTFVMISTDKAVNPTSVMGSTKRMAEMIVQYMNTISRTRFVAVRFGNVLGSRGSVIPLFKQQIQNGGPVTVTHPDMIRYFMTIPEASRLVLQAGALAEGGEVFVLDMGEPVRILDLARNLVKLSGYTEEEIPIVFSGMRPGEKMFEELLGQDEVHEEQVFEKIYRGKTPPVDVSCVFKLLQVYGELEKEELRRTLLDIANFRQEAQDRMLV
ncbi:polysaccharide biosynthesis protein [Bacillus horti]|uniref:FlaA1/EpsC-like NDP-sugar epimerase n=1 Tax=Caldalkalibacillus horti TaxID=77523 RepID=A0ABT9W0I8_9BACI|nr:nucleoside-diphosphate sugar epimerase/dehydratase [Bacillus horti]MDQ0166380.1 FlaA1/EpsC-like NDP-sugar epimerase [Bacillus horti]